VKNFVLICAWDVPISPILPILPVEKSITYLFSISPFVVPCYKARFDAAFAAA
jgi:hypothetical protein